MVDKPIDPFSMSDEDFLKLSPEQFAALSAGEALEQNEESENGSEAGAEGNDTLQPTGNEGTETSQGQDTQAGEPQDSLPGSGEDSVVAQDQTEVPAIAANANGVITQTQLPKNQGKTPAEKKPDDQASAKPGDKPGEAAKPEETPQVTIPNGQSVNSLVEFFNKITGPIKADGREQQVRSADDAVRLMQMGINYSRRMQELKPVKALGQMLQDNGLADPQKLNFLIDLSKGKPEAIQKLLADHKIDPMDLDTSKTNEYRPANYQLDEKHMVFKEAIDMMMTTDNGKTIISDINQGWDKESKDALLERPSIFQNILDQKNSGIYDKIKTELDYQRSLGYLQGVPYIQAYHQVGIAMEKAGAFRTPAQNTQTQSLAPGQQQVQPTQQAPGPIDTGVRKAAVVKGAAPTPQNLSSVTQPRSTGSSQGYGGNQKPRDYFAMSDEEFLKLKPPG